uniref:Uncharacterized protein n=1 Tax=Aegilops tauschii subsp. strangulata TaxID=200361 RepID=A0A453B4B3_AEGTS
TSPNLVGFNEPPCLPAHAAPVPEAAKQSARTRHAAAMADDVAPCTASGYLDPSYWDGRFGKEEHYEWFKDFSHFRHLLAPLLSPSLSVSAPRASSPNYSHHFRGS